MSIILFGFNDAVTQFSDGNRVMLDIRNQADIECGHYVTTVCLTSDC